jgi:hypothetical protein
VFVFVGGGESASRSRLFEDGGVEAGSGKSPTKASECSRSLKRYP